jgi:hypothetical protein
MAEARGFPGGIPMAEDLYRRVVGANLRADAEVQAALAAGQMRLLDDWECKESGAPAGDAAR